MRAVHWLYWNSFFIVVKRGHCYVKLTSWYHVASQCIQLLLGAFFKLKIVLFNGEQEK